MGKLALGLTELLQAVKFLTITVGFKSRSFWLRILTVNGKEEIEGKREGTLEKKEWGTAPPGASSSMGSCTQQNFPGLSGGLEDSHLFCLVSSWFNKGLLISFCSEKAFFVARETQSVQKYMLFPNTTVQDMRLIIIHSDVISFYIKWIGIQSRGNGTVVLKMCPPDQ